MPNPSSAADVEGVTFCEVHLVREEVRNMVATINCIISNEKGKCALHGALTVVTTAVTTRHGGKFHTSEFLQRVLASKAWAVK